MESELGHLDGAVVRSRQDCFLIGAHENSLSTCSKTLPYHRRHHSGCFPSFFLSLLSLPVPITILLILLFLAASILHKCTPKNTHSHTHTHVYALPIPSPRGKLQLAWRSSHSSWLIDFRFLSSRCDELRLLGDRQGGHSHTYRHTHPHTHTHTLYILVRTSY